MKTKIFVITLLVCAFVGTFALVACTPDKPVDPVPHTHTFSPSWEYNSTEHWHVATCEHTTERDSVAPHQLDKDGKCTVCNYVAPKMSFDELVTSHKPKLCEFVETNIVAKVLGEKDVLSKSVFVSSNSSDDLGGVDVLYTYSDGETKRVVEYVQVSVNDGVTPQAIADGTATAYKVSENKTKVFEFDAKENYLKQALANSLFKATGCEDQATKLFAEIPSQYDNTRLFSILIQDGSELQLKNIEVLKDNDNDETIIENLTNPNRFTVTDDAFITLKGTNIFCNDYILEQFEQDKEDVQITDKQLLEAIEQNCKDNLLNELPTKIVIEILYGSFDNNNIYAEDWRICQENNQITALTYAFWYTARVTSGYYTIASMNFSTPVSREDFVSGNLSSATYTQEYSLNYDPSIQEERSALANAILTACKGAPADNGSTVILVDNHTTHDAQFGEVGKFTVVEISENRVTEYQVKIKLSTSDEQYIQEVANGNYAQTQTAVEYHITGDKLTAEEQTITDKELYDAFEQNYAENLLKRVFAGGAVDMNNVANENWYLTTNQNGDIESAIYTLVYNRSEISGQFIIGSITFANPVSRENLLSGNTPDVTYKKEYLLNYDRTIQEERSALANAILTACKGAPADNGSTVILVDNGSRVDDTFGGDGHIGDFIVVEIRENGVTEYHVKIKNSTSDEQYIQEVANGNYAQTQTAVEYHITGDKLTAEEQKNVDKQLLEAIEQNCKDNMLNKLPLKSVIEEMFGSFDKNNISNENWYINQENDQIKALTYAFFYRATYTSGYYIITSMNFSTPVSREDFVAGNLPSATYKQEYSISYNPSIQEDRSALANAILTACKGAPADNGSTVILVDRGSTVDDTFGGDGHIGRFIVVEIRENGVTEYRVKIKHSTNDEQYIQEVANGNYAQTQTAVEYHITGDKLTAEE